MFSTSASHGFRLPSIDQDGIAERTHQVRLMDEIYEQVKTVLVWLDIHTHRGDLALNFEEMCYGCDYDLDEAREEYWTSFPKLCDNEYWSRICILQEILLGWQIQVMYGNRSIR
jgi:hypothetical protein